MNNNPYLRFFSLILSVLLLTMMIKDCTGGTQQPTSSNNGDNDTPSQPASITIKSTPPNAEIELGLKEVNSVVTPGTGRKVGRTPVEGIQLLPDDVVINQAQGYANIYVHLKLEGYEDNFGMIGLPDDGNLEPGKHYEINVKLTPR